MISIAALMADHVGAKRGDDTPREDAEAFNGDAQQSIAIQVSGFRGPTSRNDLCAQKYSCPVLVRL